MQFLYAAHCVDDSRFTTCTGIATYFVYYNWSLVKNVSCIKFNTRTQTTI